MDNLVITVFRYVSLAAVVVLLLAAAACGQSPSAPPAALPGNSPEQVSVPGIAQPIDCVIFLDGNTYKSVSGNTGAVDYSGTVAREVVQQSINGLKRGTIWLKDMDRPLGLIMKDNIMLISSYNGQLLFYGNFGHTPYQPNEQRVMVFKAENESSKPILEWRDYLGNKVAWIVAHYRLNPQDIHQHLSFETAKSDNTTIITRLEITYGQDVATVSVDNSDFVVANGTTTLKGPADIKSTLKVEGAIALAYDTGSALNNRLAAGNCFFAANASSNPVTVNLPAAAGNEGRIYVIKKVDSSPNTVTVLPAAGETIDGAARYVLSAAYKYISLICSGTGSGWYIIGQN
jgi:hypothetical protein